MRPGILAAAAAVLLISAPAARAQECVGVERWDVKVVRDRDAGLVNPAPNSTTISALRAVRPPSRPNARPRSRFAPTETSVATVRGILVHIRQEEDEDYHLVIVDPSNPVDPNDPQQQTSMIVEAPNPPCAGGSRFIQQIVAARQTIDTRFGGPIQAGQRVRIPVTVTGVVFFDRRHGQEGVAPNGIELHPILSITFHN